MRLIRIIFKILVIIIFCFVALVCYKPSSIMVITKSLIEYFLSSNDIKVKIKNIDITKKESQYIINLDKIYLSNNDHVFIELNDVQILPKFDLFLNDLTILLDININNFEAMQLNKRFNFDLFNFIYSNNLRNSIKTLDLKLKINNLDQDIDMKCMYKYMDETKKIKNCSLFINDKAFITIKKASFDGSIIKIDGMIQDLPLTFYKIFENIFPENSVIKSMKENQISGSIINGEFQTNFNINKIDSSKFDGTEIKASFNINNLYYKYDDEFPPVRNVNGVLIIEGDIAKLDIKNGYIADTKIDGSIIHIFWNEGGQNRLVVDGRANGKASDLTYFMKKKSLEDLKKNLINLESIKGNASTKIDIIIPFGKDVKNTYDISTKVTDLSFSALKYLYLKGELTGKFDGNIVSLSSSGSLNNSPYKLEENYNIEKDENLFNIKADLSKESNLYNLFKINSGKSILNFDYISKEQEKSLSLSSDLSKLEFLVNYPTIYKPINDYMKLNIQANYKSDLIDSFNVKLTNNKDVDISGKIIMQNANFIYDFPRIKSEYNNFKLLCKNNDKITSLDITGNEINLSKMNFNFLTSDENKNKKSIKVKSDIANARMYNGVDIKKLKIDIDCNKDMCESASISGLLNEKTINLDLSYIDNKQIWKLGTKDAGSFLKAIDIFDKIENGNLNITLETKLDNKESKGTFLLKDFLVTDPPSITRFISITSFTGFLRSLGDNKKISFSEFAGQFKKTESNLWEIFRAKGEGNYFDFLLNGQIDSKNRNVKIAGLVIPHYFVGSLIKPIPILNDLSLALRAGFTKVNPVDTTFNKEFKY